MSEIDEKVAVEDGTNEIECQNSPMADTKEKTNFLLEFFDKVFGMVKKYGVKDCFVGILMAAFIGMFGYVFFVNPNYLFERMDKYTESKHNASTAYRIESSPIIRMNLNELANSVDADRAYILEYHNGKSNPSGLQWQYSDVTFISDNSEINAIDEYQNLPISNYPIFSEVMRDGMWNGTVEELSYIDKRFSARIGSDDVKYIALQALYDSNMYCVGVLGVSYLDESRVPKSFDLIRHMNKYAIAISPYLDGKNAFKK